MYLPEPIFSLPNFVNNESKIFQEKMIPILFVLNFLTSKSNSCSTNLEEYIGIVVE